MSARPLPRPYQRSDADAVVAMALRAWEPVFVSCRQVLGPELYARVYPDWRVLQAKTVRDGLDENETWVTDDGSTITGFVNVTFDDAERSGEIYLIAVDPDHQGQGLALALTEHAVDEMRRRGMTMAIVATGGDPGHAPARATYEKAGFTPFPQVWYSMLLDPGADAD